jgi:hypothetical protein
MYNPVNMHVEDEQRLKERDLREKNKKKRYEMRFEFEQATRKECLAEQDRLDNMKLNKYKFDRVQEEVGRGFDIITNGQLIGALSNLDKTKYMKPAVGLWDRMGIQPRDEGK